MKRVFLIPTVLLIICLGTTELMVINWIWPRKDQTVTTERMKQLLAEKDQQINRLIMERERERNAACGINKDTVVAAQARPRSTEERLDPNHLVIMANLLAGEPRAKITESRGHTAIQMQEGGWDENDPVWTVLETILNGESLERITITSSNKDAATRQRIQQDLKAFGIPSKKIHTQAKQDPNQNGVVLIELKSQGAET